MEFIDQFEAHYDYDCNYMREMAKSSPEGFKTFADFLPMGQYSKSLPREVRWTAKITSTLAEDCGACVQLCIKMALEDGLNKDLVKAITENNDSLPSDLKLIVDFSKAVALNSDSHYELFTKVSEKYSKEQMTEIALTIASTKIYPTLKRALGHFKSCSFYSYDY